MRQPARLEFARVAQQRAGGTERRPILAGDAKSVERSDSVGARQVFARQLGIVLPCLAGSHRPRRRGDCRLSRQDQLAGFVPSERQLELGGRHNLEDQLTGCEIETGDPRIRAARVHGDQIVVAIAVQPILGQHGAGRNGLDDRPPHDALRQLWIFDLLADRDAVALRNQTAQVVRSCLDRYAGKRDFRRAAVVARRERQTELARRELGVVFEHFIEVAHPEKQDGLRVPGLDVAVLLHDGCIGAGDFSRHGSSTTKGFPPTLVLSRCWARWASSRVA